MRPLRNRTDKVPVRLPAALRLSLVTPLAELGRFLVQLKGCELLVVSRQNGCSVDRVNSNREEVLMGDNDFLCPLRVIRPFA